MKVAFCIRNNFFTHIGGDSIQLLKTKEFLEKNHSVQITIITSPDELNNEYAIAHIFNLATKDETAAYFEKAKKLNLKIALSTIFWDYSYSATKDYADALGYKNYHSVFLTSVFRAISSISAKLFNKPRVIGNPMRKYMRECVQIADVLLPNSEEELYKLAEFINADANKLLKKTQVVVNAINDITEEPKQIHFLEKYNLPENYILQVGRIDHTKNQLGVLLALKNDKHIPIVFLGRPNLEKYNKRVQEVAKERGNVFFINEVPHDETNLFYKNAALHVLPSLRESPGLVNLEALMNKCKIVVSGKDFLPFDTYFKNIATAVNPFSLKSIRKGILSEMKTERNMDEISKEIKRKFNWTVAAEQTYKGYLTLT